MASILLPFSLLLLTFQISISTAEIPTTLDGPFVPVTIPHDQSLRGIAGDLPDTDPRVQRQVNGFEPEQISVSLSADYDSVWISWITGEFQIGNDIKPLNPKTVKSVVHYGKLNYSLMHEATGNSLVYSQLYPFEGLQNYTSGIIHHVRLTGLEPDTMYYYTCGDPYKQAMSDNYNFRTMPMPDPKSYPGKIAIVGDLGLTYNTTTTISHIASNNPDLILLVGDVTYANLYLTNGTGSDCYKCSFSDTPIHETYQPRWDYWGRFMQSLISKVPIMVIEGNHEIEQQVENQTFVAYSSRFAFPSEESRSKSTFYYSFNAGGIHIIMLGSYIAYDKSSDQYKWLERDLANVDRSVTPWLVATWHSPWYSSYKAHYRQAECMRVAMEDLLYSYGVDIIFNGHVHAYERSNRVYNYSLDECAAVHITVGDGGNREKMAIEHADEPGKCPDPLSTPDKYMGGFCVTNFTSGPASGQFCWDRQPEFSAYRESSFGHGILEVKNSTWALWTWYRNQDSEKVAGDQIYIIRQPDLCPTPSKIGNDIKPLNPKTVKSVVHYGKLNYSLMHEATGNSLVYSQLYPFEGLQNYTSGIIHHVRLTGLEPDTMYYYTCGDPYKQAMSDNYNFRTMPMPDPKSYPGKIAIVGDLGLIYNTTTTISHIASNNPDLILLVGDVTYANLYLTNGTGSDCYKCSFSDTHIHETYQPRWDYWGRFMQSLISKVPIMVIEGNHEIEQQVENQTFVAYSSRFAFPSEESRSKSTFYYSFNAGGIHIIMLGSYIAYDKSSDQYKWLERDLANVDISVTPWLVATWHSPWYSSYKAHYRQAECMRVAMEDLLYSYGVDIIFNGHVHAYERSNRVYNYSLDECAAVHITVGDGGNREKMAIEHADEPGKCPDPLSTPDKYMGGFCVTNFTSGPASGQFCWDRQPEFSAYRESSFGHGILEVKNSTWALWTWYRNQDSEKVVGDQIYIIRQPDLCPTPSKVTKGWSDFR